MKETILDVLMYLFEHYLNDYSEVEYDQANLVTELEQIGFSSEKIHKAFYWLDGLNELQEESTPIRTQSSRILIAWELEKLGTLGCSFILFLEQRGILNSVTRELVIDRAMALEQDEVELARLKWVVLMVLFNLPGHEAELAWMEDYVMDNREQIGLH